MGIVVKGKQEARVFGFPTANIHTIDENEPGIFFGKADDHPAVIYVPKGNPGSFSSIECSRRGFIWKCVI